MTEDIVADFTGRFFINAGDDSTPTSGRIIMTKRRLVLATTDDKTTIALSRVIDVNVGSVPNHVKNFFDDSATIGYEGADGSIQSVVIESEGETLETFVAILFRCLLNGRTVAVKHPARVGGRVKDTPVTTGKLRIKKRSIEIKTNREVISLGIETIMNITRSNKLGDRAERVTLVVKSIDDDGLSMTSLISPSKGQYVNLLARFLRLEFDEIREEIEEIDLSDPEKRVLVSVHATHGDIDFTNMLDGNPAYVTNVLNSVKNKDLIVENGDRLSLTPKGRVIVSQRIEDVNA